MKSPRYISFFLAALLALLAASDLCAQWKNVAPFAIKPILRSNGAGGVIVQRNGVLWAGNSDIWVSLDTGRTWSLRTPFTGNNSVVMDISLYDEFTSVVCTGKSGLFITHDQGLTWQQIYNQPEVIEGVCFGHTPHNIIAGSINGDVLVTADGGFNWSSRGLSAFTPAVRRSSTGKIYVVSGNGAANMYESDDDGLTWNKKNGILDWDSFSMEPDPCDTLIFYAANEDIAAPVDNRSSVFVTKDKGETWVFYSPQVPKYHCGSIAVATNAIFTQTYFGIERSTDQGLTWKTINGPPNIVDTRFVTAINNNIVIAIDKDGSVWATYNSGGDSLVIAPGKNSLTIFPNDIIKFDTLFSCNSLSNFIKVTKSGCSPPRIIKSEIFGFDSASYSIIPLNGDSIGVNFYPQNSGQLNTILVFTLTDGSHDTISLQGYGIAPHPLSLSTTDQSTDTIGGSINVPITISGLDHAEDIDLVLHYDKELTYHGSFSPANVQLDIPNEQWTARSKLHIAQAKPNTILGYARFDVFNDSLTKSNVTFDSITVLTAVAPCQYILPASVTSIITPPSGCGIQTISRFMHDGTMPQLSIIPNPSSGEISISSTHDLGECTVLVYDMLGAECGRNIMKISKDSPAKFLLPNLNGVYNVRVRDSERTYDLRVVVNR